MKCCICGQEFEGYGNNPFPLCNKEDYNSRCCNDCNSLVIQARIFQINHKPDEYKEANIGDILAIYYSDESDKPIKCLKESGKFLDGHITKIDLEAKKIYGDWGNFPVNIETDQFIIVKS